MEVNKVLIVDDESLTCQLIAKVLNLQGYPTTVLTNPKNILDIIQTEKPAIILMDYHLGDAHGLEVLQTIQTVDDIAYKIPVIMTSGMNYDKESLDAGASAFLLKPFDWKELMEIIQTILNQESTI